MLLVFVVPFLLNERHGDVGIAWCHWRAHGCALCLMVEIVVEVKIIVMKNEMCKLSESVCYEWMGVVAGECVLEGVESESVGDDGVERSHVTGAQCDGVW